MRTIERKDVEAAVASNDAVLVEALPPDHWAREHLPGARNLPHDMVVELAAQVLPEKDARIIVYCSNTSCRNSRIAADRLTELGYTDVAAYEGGKQDWIEAGLPVESTVGSTA